MRTASVVVPVLLVALALGVGLVTPAAGAGTGAQTDVAPDRAAVADDPVTATALDRDNTSASQESAPEDPAEDLKGWENGYWYNESLPEVDPSDGYTDEEIAKVRARAMARIEVIRDVEFEVTPPVTVISRERYREEIAQQSDNADIPTSARLHQNVKFEALFMIGEDESYFAANQQLRASSVLGFYAYGEPSGTDLYGAGDIVLISEDGESPKVDEITLSQELFHSLQDQQLGISADYDIVTEEDNIRFLSVIEGDGNYVDFLYEQRCQTEWDCLQPSTDDGPGGPRPNIGLLVFNLPQYTEAPGWIQGVRDEGGWEAVNRLYDQPPESSEQVIHPDKYLEDSPTEVTVRDRSNDEWEILDLEGNDSVNYAEFGEASIYAMLWYSSPAVPNDDLFTNDDLEQYDYSHPASDGWDGDRLYPYVNDESAETNETGYVWKTAWDSPEDAEEFADAYTQMLTFFGESVSERQSTYRIADSDRFGDAFYVNVSDTTVTIVNAPTVEDLSGVRAGAAPEAEATATPTETATATPTETTDDGTTATNGTDTTDDADAEQEQPGFGVVVAVVAVLAVLALLRRRD